MIEGADLGMPIEPRIRDCKVTRIAGLRIPEILSRSPQSAI